MTDPIDDDVERVALAIVNNEYGPELQEQLSLEDLTEDGQKQCLRQARAAIAAMGILWKRPAEGMPKKPGKQNYEYVDCLIIRKGDVMMRPWNCEHECFDDESYDDFYCNAEDVDWYMEIKRPNVPGNRQ